MNTTTKVIFYTVLLLGIVSILILGGLDYNRTYKMITPSSPQVGQVYLIDSFANNNWLHMSLIEDEYSNCHFFLDNPTCKYRDCKGNLVWVDMCNLEIYIEDPEYRLVEFDSKEDMIMYLGTLMFKLSQIVPPQEEIISTEIY